MLRERPGIAMWVVAISAGAVFTIWSHATADSGGLLGRLLPELLAMRDDTAVIRQAVTREVPPGEQLARLGYTTSQEGICRALAEGRRDVWRLMQSVGLPQAPLAIAVGGGQFATCVGNRLLGPTAGRSHWGELLATLPNPDHELDRQYLSQALKMAHEDPVDPAALARAAGFPAPRALSYVFAPLLVYAVWGGDSETVRSLLQAGAGPDATARVELLTSGVPSHVAVSVTPLAQAERLHHHDIADALRGAGAHAVVSASRSMFDVKWLRSPSAQPHSSKPR